MMAIWRLSAPRFRSGNMLRSVTTAELQCGKKFYRSKIRATRAAVNLVINLRRFDYMRTYHCNTCGYWHLTTSKGSAGNIIAGGNP